MDGCVSGKKTAFDRFIPSRSTKKLFPIKDHADFGMLQECKAESYEHYISKEILYEEMIDEVNEIGINKNEYCLSSVKHLLTKKSTFVEKKVVKKNINLSPEKVLDAPELKDDYYLNLLDWSSKGLLSIGLGERVYLYSSSQIGQLCQKEDDYICSLSFNPQGDNLAVGLESGKIEIYDIQKQSLIRTLRGHSDRVSSSAFTYGTLFTGSRDRKIIGHDYRSHNNIISKFQGHRGEVCGLKHDPCGLASGSNDNQAIIWDLNASKMRFQLVGHQAAVKALAWCPWQRNLLATGGGTSDQTMKFWNIQTGKLINSINTQSQVCSLIWNCNDKEILSSHGFKDNQLCLWRYPELTKTAELKGHTQRVLHMALAPDNATVCTASADQTLRFWKVFQSGKHSQDIQKQSLKLNSKFYGLR